jgi:hypothetical protein
MVKYTYMVAVERHKNTTEFVFEHEFEDFIDPDELLAAAENWVQRRIECNWETDAYESIRTN